MRQNHSKHQRQQQVLHFLVYSSLKSLILTRFKSSFMNPQNNGELRSLHWLPSLRKCYLTYSLLLKRLRVIQELKRILKTNLRKSMEFVSRITKTETVDIMCIANRDLPVDLRVYLFYHFIITVLSLLFIVKPSLILFCTGWKTNGKTEFWD